MNFTLIGGSGFIGQALAKHLSARHKITIVDLTPPRDNGSFIPVNETEEIKKNLQTSDGAVLLAAKRLTPEFCFDDCVNNVVLAEKFFSLCKQSLCDNIVFLSSIGVYGFNASPTPWTEDSPTAPQNLYALSKVLAEKTALFYNHTLGCHVKILRVAQVIGSGERSGFVLNTFINNAASHTPLSLWGTGEGRRQYISLFDLTRAIEISLLNPKLDGIFNIALQDPISIKELAEKCNKIFNNPHPITQIPYDKEDKNSYCMDTSKARQVLKYTPLENLETALLTAAKAKK